MSRRRKRRGPPRCQECNQVIAWFRNTSGAWRKFNPKPIDDPKNRNGAPAYPVENGRTVWRFRVLVEELMARREIAQNQAEDEAYDMPWYVPHMCPQTTTDDPEQEA
jgi:hypothetical protein